jgi:hypothetical protein
MSEFLKTLDLVIKHWPHAGASESDPLVRKIAEIAALAGAEEQDIAELCELISDFSDEAFVRGIDAVNMV